MAHCNHPFWTEADKSGFVLCMKCGTVLCQGDGDAPKENHRGFRGGPGVGISKYYLETKKGWWGGGMTF